MITENNINELEALFKDFDISKYPFIKHITYTPALNDYCENEFLVEIIGDKPSLLTRANLQRDIEKMWQHILPEDEFWPNYYEHEEYILAKEYYGGDKCREFI